LLSKLDVWLPCTEYYQHGGWQIITMDNNRILVVDDEPDLTQVSRLALEYHGFKVDSFNDPHLALSKYRPGLYDLVILDIKMPNMDGFELYQEIKKIDDNANVCFLTASEQYYEEFRKKEYYALDRNLFIRKPIENEALVKEINKIIKK
jgi:DNA-binding response OmpR family regulator